MKKVTYFIATPPDRGYSRISGFFLDGSARDRREHFRCSTVKFAFHFTKKVTSNQQDLFKQNVPPGVEQLFVFVPLASFVILLANIPGIGHCTQQSDDNLQSLRHRRKRTELYTSFFGDNVASQIKRAGPLVHILRSCTYHGVASSILVAVGL